MGRRFRLALLTNILSPHLALVYRKLNESFQLIVITGGHEDNRQWNHHELSRDLDVREAWGISFKWQERRSNHQIWEERYTHFHPGFLIELVRTHPDAVLSNEMGARTLFALAYGLMFRTPVWVWWEGTLHTERRISRVKSLIRRYAFAKVVRRWITCGRSSTDYLESLGVSPDRILTAQNPVDERLFEASRDRYPLDLPSPIVLCVGRLTALKGIDRLLSATAELLRDGFVFSLLIVGDGPERAPLQVLASELGVQSIKWMPSIPIEKMPSVYRSADLLIFPTLQDVWGLVVNEALQCGVPVLGSRYAGAVLDLLPPKDSFNPLDESEFVEAIRRAIAGDITPPNEIAVMSSHQIAELITSDVKSVLVGQRTRSGRTHQPVDDEH